MSRQRFLWLVAMHLLPLAAGAEPAAGKAVPQRVVAMAPSLSETVAALGCSDRLVGVSDYVVWPPETLELPRLGGLHNPNVERILALAPDLVLLPSAITKVERACAAAGIRVERVVMEGMDDVRTGIGEVAALLGCPEHGAALLAEIDAQLGVISREAYGRPPVSVLLVLDRPPTGRLQHLTVSGPGSFLDELASLAGGENIFAEVGRLYFTPSLEQVLARRPDVIIELRPVAGDTAALEEQAHKEWQELFGAQPAPLVRVVSGEAVLIPGPRMADTAARLAAVLRQAGAGRTEAGE